MDIYECVYNATSKVTKNVGNCNIDDTQNGPWILIAQSCGWFGWNLIAQSCDLWNFSNGVFIAQSIMWSCEMWGWFCKINLAY